MNDQIIELTKSELKIFMKAAWFNGAVVSELSEEEELSAFEEWYEDGEWIINGQF